MAEGRGLGLSRAPRATTGRRASSRLIRALRNALYGSALYRVSLHGRRPDALALNPGDPWPGERAAGRALLSGEYAFAGQRVSITDGFPWHPEGVHPAWLEEAHGFAWLRDLEAVGTAEARAAARNAVADWIDRCGAWEPLAWRPDVLGRRVVAWLGHAPFVFHVGDVDLKSRALASLGEQLRHLGRTVGDPGEDEDRFAALKGLLFGALCLPGGGRRLAQGLRLLDDEIARQVLADGGHATRSPSVLFRVFADLVALRALFATAGEPLPDSLLGAIDRLAPMLRFFRHGDGGLALFNDSNEEDPAAIDIALSLGEATGKAPASAPHCGFERLAARRAMILADVGAPPTTPSRHTHAGLLSFEMSVGKRRLIVNCGAHAADRADWHEAQRATAAHSTLTVDDSNAIELLVDGTVRNGPRRVTCARHEDGGSIWLDAVHDGYRDRAGVSHRRRLYLDASGADLRGEDVVNGGTAFAIRFHLHPEVKASLVGDGNGALLRLADGEGWRLRVAGASLQLAESVYLGRRGEVRRTEQVVLSGPLKGGRTTVKWSLSTVGGD